MLLTLQVYIVPGGLFQSRENAVIRLHFLEGLLFIEIETSFGASGNELVPSRSFPGRLKRSKIMLFPRNLNPKTSEFTAELVAFFFGYVCKQFWRYDCRLR